MENESHTGQEQPPIDEQTIPPPPAAEHWFRKPADYYSTPPESHPSRTMPKWVPLGCGGAGCLILVLMLAAAAFFGNEGAPRVLSWMFRTMETETMQMIAADVPVEKREELRQELKTLTGKIEQEEVGLVAVQSVLQELQAAIRDQTLTRDEVDALIGSLQKLNSASREAPASTPEP